MHLDVRSEITTERDLLQRHAIPFADDADHRALDAEEERVRRDRQHGIRLRVLEAHLRIAAREKLALCIVHLEFGEQRARSRVERPGGPHNLRLKSPPGDLRQRESGKVSGDHRPRVILRHAHKDAQPVRLRDAEKFAARAGRHELAHIERPHRHRPGKWRGDPAEADHFLEPLHLCARSLDCGFLQREIARLFIRLLTADGLRHEHLPPATRGGFRERTRSLDLRKLSATLREIAIHFRRVEFREELILFHLRADVHEPAAHVAVRARVDRRLAERLHFTGKYERCRSLRRRGRREIHRHHRKFARLVSDHRALLGTRKKSQRKRAGRKNHRDHQHFSKTRRGWRRAAGCGSFALRRMVA